MNLFVLLLIIVLLMLVVSAAVFVYLRIYEVQINKVLKDENYVHRPMPSPHIVALGGTMLVIVGIVIAGCYCIF